MWNSLPTILGGLVCACLESDDARKARGVCKSWHEISPAWATINDEQDLKIAELGQCATFR